MYEIWMKSQDKYERKFVSENVKDLEPVLLQAFALSAEATVGFEDEILVTFRGQNLLTLHRSGAMLFREFVKDLRNDERVGTNEVQERQDTEFTGRLGSLV